MSKISYIVGRTVDARRRLLDEKMFAYDRYSFLHLVPTRGKVMDLEADPRFWPKRKVNTLARVIYQIFEQSIRFKRFRDHRPIDDGLKSVLIKKILERRGKQRDGLAYFSRLPTGNDQSLDFPGIYKTISEFFSILVNNNYQDLYIENLARKIIRVEKDVPGIGERRYALESDLAWLFGDYKEIKREIKGYDGDDIISSVRSYLMEGGEPHILEHADVLIFDGFIDVSRIEEDILFCLFRQAGEVWWLLDYDSQTEDPIKAFKDAAGREAKWHWKPERSRGRERSGRYEAYRIFAPFVSLIQRLDGEGFEFGVEKAVEAPFHNPVAGGLYFHGQADESPSDSLKIKSFPSRVEEIRAIAREIKRNIHEYHLDVFHDLGRFRVIFSDLNEYSSLISEIFSEYQIPFSLTKGLPLSSHPITNIFRTIFWIPLNYFNTEDIFRLFSSSLIQGNPPGNVTEEDWLSGLSQEYHVAGQRLREVQKAIQSESRDGTQVELDMSLFDQVARKSGLNHLGADLSRIWEGELLRVRDYYRDRVLRAKLEQERDALILEYYRFLAQINQLAKRLVLFGDLTNHSNPQGIVDCFFRILDTLGFPQNIVDLPEEVSGPEPGRLRVLLRRNVKAYSVLRDLIFATAAEVRVAQEFFEIKGGYRLLRQFFSTFDARLNNSYLLDERNPNVVRISEWLEIRGRSFDYIFAGGLTADKFPLEEVTNFLMPESPDKIFRTRDPVDESKHLFSHALRNYRKRLYLSYPSYKDEKAVQPSPVLVDLEAMMRSHLPTKDVTGRLEEVFKWERNPYFASRQELLDATRTEKSSGTKERYSPLRSIILNDQSVSEDVIRGINALCSRWATDGLFEYDGLVWGSARFREFLRVKGEILSPSQLEVLANCPMRYLFEHIYGLKTIEKLGAEVSAKDMGEHLHAVLSIFFEKLKSEGKNVADVGLERAFMLAVEVADSYFTRHSFLNRIEFFEFQKRAFLDGLDQDWACRAKGAKEREGTFAQLLCFEEREFRDMIPAGVEYGFGQEGAPQVLLGNTKIQGFIDRFDISKGSQDRVCIYDYKTGRIPLSHMVKKGLSFQLPAYIVALKTAFQCTKVSAAFYALKRDVLSSENPLKQRMNDRWEGMPGLDISGVRLLDDYVEHLMGLLEKGYFHHSADEMMCAFCEFKVACFKDMRRINHILDSEAEHQIYSGKKNLEKWKKVDDLRKSWKATARSMQQAISLKTESARRGHFDSVMGFRGWLTKTRHAQPFHPEYIDELLDKIDEFEKQYLSL